ncbi:MAG TPA: amino acid permease, partial [Myxococcota bacterium]|nr:amino acid permease [Myxococcota bacterium]
KAQMLIFVILAVSFGAVFTGSMANVTTATNPEPVAPMSFWQGFAMFYPAATGIEAGMAMSGSLRNPSRSLAVGTLTSLATCGALYLALATFLSMKIPADVLRSNPLVVQEFASVRQLIILGIWGATLSSALGCVLSAPRMLQAVAEDGVLPRMLARTDGPRREPRVALLVSAAVAMVLLLTTQMDQIIPILTMVCLIGYGTLNFVAGFADLIHHPSWRPTFKTPWYVAFVGAAACLMVMLMVNPAATFVSLALLGAVYGWVARRNIKVQFEDVRESIFFYLARKALYLLTDRMQHAKNWHLNLLAFVPSPSTHRDFVHFVAGLTHRTGILTFATFLPESWQHSYRLDASEKTLRDFFSRDRIPCLVEANATPDVTTGMRSFVQTYGLGPLQPNTVALNQPADPTQAQALFETLETAATRGKNIVLFRGTPEAGETGGVFPADHEPPPRQVEIWWGGAYRNNFSLMLYLAKVLLSTARFKDARLVIKTAVFDANTQASLTTYLDGFIAKHRLNADFEVLQCEHGAALDTLAAHATDSDLVFMGLKPFPRAGGDGAYAAYYASLAGKLATVRNVALVAASETVTFKEMFQD